MLVAFFGRLFINSFDVKYYQMYCSPPKVLLLFLMYRQFASLLPALIFTERHHF